LGWPDTPSVELVSPTTHTPKRLEPIVEEEPRQDLSGERPEGPRCSPAFFRGLLIAIPLTTALWIAFFLATRVDI
jgi:hypothetical protein